MKSRCILLLVISQLFLLPSYAQQNTTSPTHRGTTVLPRMLEAVGNNNLGFITNRDKLNETNSGITIKNVSGISYDLTGLYIQSLCSNDGSAGSNYGAAVGVLWSNVTVAASETKNIGANFLYNMIMNWLYQNHISTGGGENITPGGNTSKNWLVFLGVVKGPTVTSTANIFSPTAGYGNDLVYISQPDAPQSLSYSQQLCVTCDDSTQTCVLESPGACYHGESTSNPEQDFPCNLDGSTACATGVFPP